MAYGIMCIYILYTSIYDHGLTLYTSDCYKIPDYPYNCHYVIRDTHIRLAYDTIHSVNFSFNFFSLYNN